jgi:hypothetical protein
MPRDDSAGLSVGAQPPKTVIAALQKAAPRIIAADFTVLGIRRRTMLALGRQSTTSIFRFSFATSLQ